MAERPNVLILYPDQMRFDVLGCAGNRTIRTPHIDRLAAEGVRFEHAYTSFPLCCPFRASLMTGKYAHANGMFANHYPIPLDQTFLADVFAAADYQTGYVGKWHLDGGRKHSFVRPHERLGFQRFIGFSRGHVYDRPIFYRDDDPRPRTSRRFEADAQSDHLIELMRQFREDPAGRPFLAMVCYGPPHPPTVMPPRYETMYAPETVPVRANTPQEPGQIHRGRDFLARYYGLTTWVDENVGRVLGWLDEAGLAENTIVYLISDHGEMADEHGLIGKSVCYEASMRVPLIVRWPAGLPGGRVVEHLIDGAVDTMPTLLDLCGVPIPDTVGGTSFTSLLHGGTEPVREAVFYERLMEREGPEASPIPQRGVRTRDWLYTRTSDAPRLLIDLNRDPLEMHNLVDSPAHAAIRSELDAARRRPLLDAMTIRRGKNKGKPLRKLRPEVREEYEQLGRERVLIYKTLVLTGLRKNELASITVGQLELDGPYPYAVLHAADEKNRRGSNIPLRADLVADIRGWLDEKLAVIQREAIRRGETPPDALPLDAPVFTVPASLVRILDRDLALAGIPKRDARGWTVDVHALRHTFGTLLSKGNVAPRTAQAAMRHSSLDLTMNVYTDPQLLDVAGALEALPELGLGTVSLAEEDAMRVASA